MFKTFKMYRNIKKMISSKNYNNIQKIALEDLKNFQLNISNYLDFCLDKNDPKGMIAILSVINCPVQGLSFINNLEDDFNNYIQLLIENKNYNFIDLLIKENFLFSNYGVYLNKLILLNSIKNNDHKIFSQSLLYIKQSRVEPVEIINSIFITNPDFFEYVYNKHYNILEEAEEEGDFAFLNPSLYKEQKAKIKIKQNIYNFI